MSSLNRSGGVAVLIACWFLWTGALGAENAPAGKLIINSAAWGDLDDDKTKDVTAKVSAMVKDNNLSVIASSSTFGDPAPGQAKKLKIGYTIDGIYRSKTVDENQTLDISTRLVIVKAIYGDLAGGTTADVTDQVAEMVRKNKLMLKAGNDSFGDPAEGVVKKLRVDYIFDGVRKSRTVNENEELTITD